MDWFAGDITDAIKETQSYGKTFVVFVEGDDDESHQMLENWNDSQVVSSCSREKCVVVKLEATSEQGVNFAKCYPVICVPSTFIINDGIPVDIVAGVVPSDELARRLNAVIEQNGGAASSAGESSSSSDVGASSQPAVNDEFQQRVNRAKEIIQQRQEQKAKEEEEEAKEKEMKRRQEGNEVSLARRQVAENNARKLAEELAKAKAEEKAARDAVREQIKRDRADRNAKYETEKSTAASLAQQQADDRRERQQQLQQSQSRPVDMSRTRLQFRLPDGSSVNKEFDSSERLDVAYQFIGQHCAGKLSNIRIVAVHPRREFNKDDREKTMQELGLTPSAALIVLPGFRASSGSSTALSSVVNVVRMILAPLMLLFTWLVSMFGLGQTGGTAQQQQQQAARPQQQQQQQTDTSSSNQGAVRRRAKEGGSNIHRLHDGNEDEDKTKKTWNGNSTQQL